MITRLAGVFLCALPAVRELFQYVNDPRYVCAHCAPRHPRCSSADHLMSILSVYTRKAVRMGQHVWLLLATIGTELLLIMKWSQGQFEKPFPSSVKWAWLMGALLLVLYPTVRVSLFIEFAGLNSARARPSSKSSSVLEPIRNCNLFARLHALNLSLCSPSHTCNVRGKSPAIETRISHTYGCENVLLNLKDPGCLTD